MSEFPHKARLEATEQLFSEKKVEKFTPFSKQSHNKLLLLDKPAYSSFAQLPDGLSRLMIDSNWGQICQSIWH